MNKLTYVAACEFVMIVKDVPNSSCGKKTAFETTAAKKLLKFSFSATDNGYSCEKGKPLERAGRKASDPVMMDSGVAQQLDKFSNEAHFSQEGWAFLLPLVCKFDGFGGKKFRDACEEVHVKIWQ